MGKIPSDTAALVMYRKCIGTSTSFPTRHVLVQHQLDAHPEHRFGEEPGNDVDSIIQDIILQIRSIRQVYKRHRYDIARRSDIIANGIEEIFNYPVRDEHLTTDWLMDKVQTISSQKHNAFRFNFSFGFILDNVDRKYSQGKGYTTMS